MPRAPKKCGRWGCDEDVVGRTYCRQHSHGARSPSSLAAADPAERRARAAVVRAWVRAHGWWCPGYERPGHPSRDLTAAHTTAVADGGSVMDGALCRSCNSRQNDKPA